MKKRKTSRLTYFIISVTIIVIFVSGFYLYHQFKLLSEEDQFTLQDRAEHQKQHTPEKTEEIQPLKTVVDQQNPVYQSIDQYLESVQFNGTIAVFEDGKLKMDKGYGYQDFENKKKNSPNTVYLIGSAQKFLTGMMVKKLELENKIHVEDSVTKYIPDFQLPQEITIRDLLRHQSGLYKYTGLDDVSDLDSAVKAIETRGIDPQFYHKHLYNDANYLVLAKVIENVTGQSYTQNYYHYIANPFRLMHSAFFDDERYQGDMAKGYRFDNKTQNVVYRKPKYLSQYYGAGNLYMSAHDMGVLVRKLQTNRVFPEKVTVPYLHELLTVRYPEKYRYGFYVYNDFNRINGIFFGHIFTTYYNDKYIIVLGTNYDQPKPNNNEERIKHIYFDILKQHKIINILV
ncbi:serine hydrolase domain-containing protein [Staphylococcus intermedius]|uniref:Autolysis and methicillin resistant-related protein n=1 Tax=Staphylococcus intermedius NCTC 11048 TaxID=1141106 RepID=A0A380GAZ1_STAIN|nr:serine hydrolase domain-containing protein [Staphylococcus intermedius]PNZ54262.1 methicillin resistance protein FmtA [Staphylococcus intermedius NCTC 11048]SUM47428.1 autolysis and methicillin resistant-related protein [Staphylococcus intermedius NCTC 11048]